eukprot:CAMPEP_0170532350 /NCGR_PEP_ID=MMETSP0209-20121228/71031_1 /TAXON_ID=665100 ORGANISM="Litonotus pictus, Strain P1" /NCGR_SAMPLE_ID=MMETSP0209 /ASSEMBLY_ACC=CAM_ASM_000301 /LENGTH=748 /DNA_ID=CAMNT_0010828319 /DNA_START=266 /DNA_END=2512 /DNA_ORIENTATION=+
MTEVISSISTLIDLKITITRQEEALSLLSEVPQLQRLNEKSTRDEIEIIDIDEKDIEHVSLNKEINNFNHLFMKINQIVNPKVKSTDTFKKMIENFQQLLNSEIERINNCIDSSVPNYIYATSVSGSKSRIYKFFLDNIIALIFQFNILKQDGSVGIGSTAKSTSTTRKNSRSSTKKNLLSDIKEDAKENNKDSENKESREALAKSLKEEKEVQDDKTDKTESVVKSNKKDEYFEDIKDKEGEEKLTGAKSAAITPRKTGDNVSSISKDEQIKVINELLKLILDCGKFLSESTDESIEILNKLHPKIEEQHEFIKKLEKSENENNIMVVELERKSEQQSSLIKSQAKDIEALQEKLKRYESGTGESPKVAKSRMRNNSVGATQNNMNSVKNSTGYSRMGRTYKDSAMKNRDSMAKVSSSHKESTNDRLTNIKIMSLKNLLDMIQEIYQSKTNYDKKCFDNKAPRETMEQHMYTYLNYKYGLKGLVIEYSAAVVNSIKKYAKENVDVSLFGKILRNDLEEDYRIIYYKLKSTLFELLVYYLRTKNQYKSSSEINEMAKTKTKGILSNEEWNAIIYFLYEDKDAKAIEEKMIDIAEKEEATRNKGSNQGYKIKKDTSLPKPPSINYSTFEKVIMNYQIISRIGYLRNFTLLFKEIDSDGDGIINDSEFMVFVEKLKCYSGHLQEQTYRLLSIVDPHYLRKLTYSDCIGLFSKEQLDFDGSVINVMDFIAYNWSTFSTQLSNNNNSNSNLH